MILYNYSDGCSWYTCRPNHGSSTIAGELGTGASGHIVGTYDKDEGPGRREARTENSAIKIGETVSGALQAGARHSLDCELLRAHN